MKTHKTIMAGMLGLGIVLIAFGPVWNIGRGFGLVLLICPLMMIGMMSMMGSDKHKHR